MLAEKFKSLQDSLGKSLQDSFRKSFQDSFRKSLQDSFWEIFTRFLWKIFTRFFGKSLQDFFGKSLQILFGRSLQNCFGKFFLWKLVIQGKPSKFRRDDFYTYFEKPLTPLTPNRFTQRCETLFELKKNCKCDKK